MKKEKFKYLYSFKYKNKEYIYLISKNYPFYFLEYNTDKNIFDFPDISTFKNIYNKFYLNNNLLSFNYSNNFKKIKSKLLNKEFNITPLIKTTSGFISLVLALTLCGCTQTNNVENNKPTNASQTQNKEQEIYNYFKEYNMEVTSRNYDGNDYIFVNEFINNNNKKQITLNNLEEFREYQNIDFVPTWDDVINAFNENKNINDEQRKIILESINNMKDCKELKELDLSVLYVNAKRIKFKYLTTKEMIDTLNRDSIYAYFDTVSGIVYLPSDKSLRTFEFIHEVLGHGTLAFREETDDKLIVFDCTNYLMLPNEDRYTGYSLGTMVSEGGANMIAHFATNDYSVNTFYELFEEELRVIASLCNISMGELLNHKGISLYDLMYKNGISTPVEYVFKMDAICKGQIHIEFSELMERLLVDATEEKFMNSNKDKQKEIIKSTIDIINDSYFKDKEELNYSYNGGTINYNFKESVETYEENMNNLKGNK